MLYLIGPDGLVNRRFVNFQKMVWMTMVHNSHPCCFFGNLHTFGLHRMQRISDFSINRILRVCSPSMVNLVNVFTNSSVYKDDI